MQNCKGSIRQNGRMTQKKKGEKRMNLMFRRAGMQGQRKKKKNSFFYLKENFSQMSTFSFHRKPRSGSGSGFVLKNLKRALGLRVPGEKGGRDHADFVAEKVETDSLPLREQFCSHGLQLVGLRRWDSVPAHNKGFRMGTVLQPRPPACGWYSVPADNKGFKDGNSSAATASSLWASEGGTVYLHTITGFKDGNRSAATASSL